MNLKYLKKICYLPLTFIFYYCNMLLHLLLEEGRMHLIDCIEAKRRIQLLAVGTKMHRDAYHSQLAKHLCTCRDCTRYAIFLVRESK